MASGFFHQIWSPGRRLASCKRERCGHPGGDKRMDWNELTHRNEIMGSEASLTQGSFLPQHARPLVMDVGFNIGQDTARYLQGGFRVVGIEANQALLRHSARQQIFADAIAARHLVLLNHAIGNRPGTNLTFFVHPVFDEVSSLDKSHCVRRGASMDKHRHTRKCGPVMVSSTTCSALLDHWGLPYYMKVDVEGADDLCTYSVAEWGQTHQQRGPPFYSAETMSLDALHAMYQVGYTGLKCQSRHHMGHQSSHASFGDLIIDRYTNSTLWRNVSLVLTQQRQLFLESRWGKDGENKFTPCPRADVHLRHAWYPEPLPAHSILI